MTLIEEAFAAVEREEQKRVAMYEKRLPMRRARFCDVLWEALAIKMDSKDLDPGEPETVIDNLRFVLLLPPDASNTTEAYLGLRISCAVCETSLTFSIASILALGLLLNGDPPLCSLCTAELEQKQQATHEQMQEGVARQPTPEDNLVTALRAFIHASS